MSLATLSIFLAAVLILSVTPGPGMLYVLARTLRGGRAEGLKSVAGTGVAGMVHTLGAALGISALFATSALAFSVVKFAGAAYLVYLGLRTLLARDRSGASVPAARLAAPGAFREALVTEVLNPKTALFFLAFLPQFIQPQASVFWQFVALGAVTTLGTSGVDLIVVFLALPLSRRKLFRRGRRYASGGTLVGLGVYVALDGA